VLELVLGLACLVAGVAVLAYTSDKAVEHSISIASEWGLPPLIVGLVLVSWGTNLPEITTNTLSSALGHGDIAVGDSLGSVLANMTLILGLLPFLAGTLKAKRKEVAIIGACEVLALMLAVAVAEKGNISQIDSLFLVTSWPIFMLLIRSATARNPGEKEKGAVKPTNKRQRHHFWIAILGFVGVAIGSMTVIESVIVLSKVFHVSEYLISFFVVAVGTSLPEFVVNLTAARKGQYELAIGDLMGSSLLDASFSIGIGPLIFPVGVSGNLALVTGLYAMFVSTVVVLTLASREKVGKITGAFFIILYLLSYATLGYTRDF